MSFKCDKAFIFSFLILVITGVIIIVIWDPSNGIDNDTRLLYVAAGILVGLGLIFILAMGMYYWDKEPTSELTTQPGRDIFKACVKIIPPIVMLVIGYYFGASSHDQSKTKEISQNNAKQEAINK